MNLTPDAQSLIIEIQTAGSNKLRLEALMLAISFKVIFPVESNLRELCNKKIILKNSTLVVVLGT